MRTCRTFGLTRSPFLCRTTSGLVGRSRLTKDRGPLFSNNGGIRLHRSPASQFLPLSSAPLQSQINKMTILCSICGRLGLAGLPYRDYTMSSGLSSFSGWFHLCFKCEANRRNLLAFSPRMPYDRPSLCNLQQVQTSGRSPAGATLLPSPRPPGSERPAQTRTAVSTSY